MWGNMAVYGLYRALAFGVWGIGFRLLGVWGLGFEAVDFRGLGFWGLEL